ncbi:MAG: hypothetical protein C4532_05015 [Candidatus Abyssobacteria bacterium SURF_17]|uniref:LemA family protein n=1 Tax=Candidatus Abyssobacteria bacterium SURF_17 TaxID=2093361 RepID=A0A419F3K4_9BACT|nr:MAG: hypothetical protein C4532_05015 [Candidatus Abyssubacteria bacterium SURF_17]
MTDKGKAQAAEARNLRIFVRLTLILVGLALLSPATAHAQPAELTSIGTSLLVVSFLLSVCILVVSGFTLWQSHRFYLDTVRLSREITATTTELHQKVVELIYNLKDFLAHESEVIQLKEHKSPKTTAKTVSDVNKIAESISQTEDKIRALEKTLGKLNEQLNFNFQASDLPRKLASLNDTEYAVLLKLSQDPRFFEKHSFTSFGVTPKVLDSLLSRQLIVFDRDGKAEVPKDVALAIKHSAPGN